MEGRFYGGRVMIEGRGRMEGSFYRGRRRTEVGEDRG